MKICVDLDGTITKGIFTHPEYHRCIVERAMREFLAGRVRSGDSVTIYTARREADREVTEEWLLEHNIEYHHLVMGKPYADIYIDDKAVSPKEISGWIQRS